MKRTGFFMAFILAFSCNFGIAENVNNSDFNNVQSISIQSELTTRILKLTSQKVDYTFEQLLKMYEQGLVTIKAQSRPNYYLVSIQQAGGGILEVIILDSM